MPDNFRFNARGTSKEEVKGQIRGDSNRDCPDSIKQAACAILDTVQLPAGHTMRVELQADAVENTQSYDFHVETSAS